MAVLSIANCKGGEAKKAETENKTIPGRRAKQFRKYLQYTLPDSLVLTK